MNHTSPGIEGPQSTLVHVGRRYGGEPRSGTGSERLEQGFLVNGTLHAFNHSNDLHLDWHPSDRWQLGALSLLAAGLLLHLQARWAGRAVERRQW